MFIFIHRWFSQPENVTFWRSLPPLFMCGLCFGLGAAAKWSSIFAVFGLVVIYAINLYRRRERVGFIAGTLIMSLVFFIAVPAVVYLISYIPYVRGDLTLPKLWNVMWDNQVYMYNYHTRFVLDANHTYSSDWYMWIANARPVNYFFSGDGETKTLITAFNNPILAWGGFAALVFCAVDVFRRKSFNALFIVCAYLTVTLPWVLVDRLTFAYHYFPASMFLTLAISYVFWRLSETGSRKAKNMTIAFTAAAVALFAMFYPVIAGMEAPIRYTANVLKWMPGWTFY
jgi:dolichyl-phosphate-mannose--protein O-mannosyl transferase